MLCTPNQFSRFQPLEFGEDETTLTWADLSQEKQDLFIKFVFVIKYLSDEAIEEANEDLERIIEFYSEDMSQTNQISLPIHQKTIKAKILPPKIRPSLVLDDF